MDLRGGSLIVQGYSGIGKSSFTLQMALSWAVADEFFGLKPKGALRTLFIQAENDLGDIAEPFQDITRAWDGRTREKLKSSFRVERVSAVCGAEKVARMLRSRILDLRPDIIFLDPLLTYFGEDIIKQAEVSRFFRNHLQPIQNETGVVIVFVHHLGKPPQNAGERIGPSHYQGLGSSDIINWTRETITLSEVQTGIFKMELGKRKGRAGFSEKFLKHSKGGILWEEHTEIKSSSDADRLAYKDQLRELESFIRQQGSVCLAPMKVNAKFWKYSFNTIKTALDTIVLHSAKTETPIYSYKAYVSQGESEGKKNGPANTIYSIHPKPESGIVDVPPIDPGFVKTSVENKDGKLAITATHVS